MRRVLSLLSVGVVSLTLGLSSQARADVFAPGATTAQFAGLVIINRPITQTCNMIMILQTNALGTGAIVTGIDFTGTIPCNVVDLAGFYNLDATSPTAVDFQGLYATSLVSMPPFPCGPTTVSATWNASAQSFTFNNVDIGGSSCLLLNGSVTKTSGPTLTITD